MSNSRNLPIGIQDFEDLRTNDYLYVDKTAYIYKLVTTGKPYFQGKKELFEGLAIAELEKEWLEYPVFYIDLNVESYIGLDSLYKALDTNLEKLEKIWGKEQRLEPAAGYQYG